MNKEISKKYMRQIIRNESGMVLLMALLTMALLSLIGTAALTITEIEIKISANDKVAKEAFYIAEAGIEHAWAVLKTSAFADVLEGDDNNKNETDDNGVLEFGSNVPFGNGNYDVKVTDNDDGDGDAWDDNDGRIIVTSTGTSPDGSKRKVELVVSKITLSPTGIHGAVTSNGPILTSGNMRINGQNYALDGITLIASSGIFGISTKGEFTQGGNSNIGGTDSIGEDWEPSENNPSVVEENASWDTLTTPEKVLGLTVDQLKMLALSGVNGSQHVTDPDNLIFDDDNPLKGITYVELPDIGSPGSNIWNASGVDFDGSSGILIVHNSATNAVLKNTSHGAFKGIIIADNYEKIHNTIIGAVVTLTDDPDSDQIGNGNGAVLYSQEAIANALASGSTGLTAESWREVF
ncbi:pilus assembly PilX N-terminal domain-containing protein [Nitrospira defluvii]|nr:pilus assembly PilX N-terminal domain-containing protein [Nitrospira defluvii]